MMGDFTVLAIDQSLAFEWFTKKHYAKRIPPISYCFGLYKGSQLLGVLTVGKPASNPLCIGICGKEYSKYVFELNRLIVQEGLPKNTLSFFLSSCLRHINSISDGMILVSYADTSMGHTGYIYQATNWLYTGMSAKRTEKYDPINENRHPKSVIESIDKEQYKFLPNRERSRKHRYVMFIGRKRKHLKRQLKYPILPYPKEQNSRYDASYVPISQEIMTF